VPRPHRSAASTNDPDTIVVYKRSHEITCRDGAQLEDEVTRTVVHERGQQPWIALR
jgi:predicted Zn-dependent protease with MMP-like domain